MSTLSKQHSLLQEHFRVFCFAVEQRNHSPGCPHSRLASFSSLEEPLTHHHHDRRPPCVFCMALFREQLHAVQMSMMPLWAWTLLEDVGCLYHCVTGQLTRHSVFQRWSRSQFPTSFLKIEVRSSRSEERCPVTIIQMNKQKRKK